MQNSSRKSDAHGLTASVSEIGLSGRASVRKTAGCEGDTSGGRAQKNTDTKINQDKTKCNSNGTIEEGGYRRSRPPGKAPSKTL